MDVEDTGIREKFLKINERSYLYGYMQFCPKGNKIPAEYGTVSRAYGSHRRTYEP